MKNSFFTGKKFAVDSGSPVGVNHAQWVCQIMFASWFIWSKYEKENVVKKIFLYQQHRFANLGQAAALFLEALPII